MTEKEFIKKYRARLLAYGYGHFAEDIDDWKQAAKVIFGEEPITYTDWDSDDYAEHTVK